ncbi:two-component system sensor histidine kinase NreB [Salirhabdus euzebyi]|uniref:Oxygen sensor histidine kinase NreB n=1 Tax=Salirhabdus euzebyi TaxID=394506 RepID=A0A841Q6K5_9BACI|nr:ATP-binding protein [Salirhabdus euzebyi]MBB6454031.1 two-component system sensor histidine kinase NreB [Salirhabdus euzebyi]
MELKAFKYASNYIIQSQEEEIKRIALELHEGISQNLYSLSTGMEFLQSAMEDPALKQYANEMTELMKRTIQEVRLLSVELYPTTIDTLGLISAIKSYIKLFTSSFGIVVDLQTTGREMEISEGKSLAIFRSCQEALINIAKYADTSDAKLTILWGLNTLTIHIEDEGKGFELEEENSRNSFKGIAAMKQRMTNVGGECMLHSEIGRGTKVTLQLPVQD